jgi:arylsulfatase A-like enzyme
MGVVTSSLEMTGMLEDTIIIVASDNGGDFSTGASNHPCATHTLSNFLLGLALVFFHHDIS